jgi:ribonuclease HII
VARLLASRTLEQALHREGCRAVAGVDEAGRGCLAGPVTAAAVIMHPDRPIPGLADSKTLTPRQREALYLRITHEAACWSVVSVPVDDIDRLNIHQASFLAMRRALEALPDVPDAVLVDGFAIPHLPWRQEAIIKGDQSCAVIAAASIVAKVTRDRLMQALHEADPRYGFDRHKGYGTAAHVQALKAHGRSTQHRRTFMPKALMTQAGSERQATPPGEGRP